MPILIQNDDLKRLFTGAAGAVVAGLLLGVTVQPRLTDNLLAPQQEMGVSATRTYAAPSERGVGAYTGQVPDYVVGTRWTQPQPVTEQVLAYEERVEPASYIAPDAAGAASADDYAATAEATHVITRWQDGAVEPPHYPSERGSTYYESDLPDPPSDDPRDYAPT
jgi:hypothetical protein